MIAPLPGVFKDKNPTSQWWARWGPQNQRGHSWTMWTWKGKGLVLFSKMVHKGESKCPKNSPHGLWMAPGISTYPNSGKQTLFGLKNIPQWAFLLSKLTLAQMEIIAKGAKGSKVISLERKTKSLNPFQLPYSQYFLLGTHGTNV